MFSQRLRSIREARGLSQIELAKRCKLNEQQIYRYEANMREPSASTLKKLAEALEVTADYLLGLVDDPTGKLDIEDLSEDERRWLFSVRHESLDVILRSMQEIWSKRTS